MKWLKAGSLGLLYAECLQVEKKDGVLIVGAVAHYEMHKVAAYDLGLTQTTVGDDDKRSSLAMTPSLLTPCWDGNRRGRFFDMGNLQTRVHLKHTQTRKGLGVRSRIDNKTEIL